MIERTTTQKLTFHTQTFMNNYMAGFALLILMLMILLSAFITAKANKELEADKKAKLLDLFSRNRLLRLGGLFAIIVLYFLTSRFGIAAPRLSYILYLLFILVFIAYNGYSTFRTLKKNDFPASYIRSFMLSSSLRLTGILLFWLLLKWH